MGKTIEESIAEMETRIVVSGMTIQELNDMIWGEGYEKGITPEQFAEAVAYIRRLQEIAERNEVEGEAKARIFLTESRLVYYRDKEAGTKSDEAYTIAMEGLKYAEKPGTKVSLLNVASDTKAKLVDDLKKASELANESCAVARDGSDEDWGKAENNAALRLLDLANRLVSSDDIEKAKSAFYNAIEHFKKALEAHQKAGNKRQIGHAHNNMILCYQRLAKIVKDSRKIEMCNKALEQAELAKKAYGDSPKNAIHAISANYRKGKTHELKAEMYALQSVYLFINLFYAIQCYTENAEYTKGC
jgi:tetratricopeptide (TPR) repeat protein